MQLEAPGLDLVERVVDRYLGLDLGAYRSRQLLRRLQAFAVRHGCGNLTTLAGCLAIDPKLRERFRNFLTINVTEFLRNPEKWQELAQSILPTLARRRPALRLWSAGCSRGAEPYSLALVLLETAGGTGHQILATDIDEEVLAAARHGIYEEGELRHVPPAWRRRHFEALGDGRWRVSTGLRRLVRFQRHDLLRDPFPQGFDLIVCRNVVIYFTDEAKDAVFRRLAAALQPGGVLFIGGTETLFRPQRYGLEALTPGFYRKGGGEHGQDPGGR